jgi:hypothetical protein
VWWSSLPDGALLDAAALGSTEAASGKDEGRVSTVIDEVLAIREHLRADRRQR